MANSKEVLAGLLKHLKTGLLLTGAIVISACQLSPQNHDASAQNEGRGLGGTGIQAGDDGRGIGGTGQIAENRGIGGTGVDTDGRGIGGTGQIAENRGIGGTGIDTDGRGIGGTGQVAENRGIGGTGIDTDGRGIGGTGQIAENRGIGGTGIRTQDTETEQWLAQLKRGEKVAVVGTINDFGSVWVNGLHIHFDEQTPVTVDGQTISAVELLPGQRAVITAVMIEGKLWAESIEIIHEVIGPVSRSLPEKNSFMVLGQEVRLTTDGQQLANAAQSLPSNGQWVRVSGQRNTSDAIIASRVQVVEPQLEALLRGRFEQTAEGFNIGSQSFESALDINNLKQNGFVVLKAHVQNGQSMVTNVSPVTSFAQRDDISLVTVERLAESLARSGPYLSGIANLDQRIDKVERAAQASVDVADKSVSKIVRARIIKRDIRIEQIVNKAPVNWSAKPRVDRVDMKRSKDATGDVDPNSRVDGHGPLSSHQSANDMQDHFKQHALDKQQVLDKQRGDLSRTPEPISLSVPPSGSGDVRPNGSGQLGRPENSARSHSRTRIDRPERPAREFRRPIRPEKTRSRPERPRRPE